MSFEESLICHAAPTLASIKIANLYNFKFDSDKDCQMTINHFNSLMNPKGIYIELLKEVWTENILYTSDQRETRISYIEQHSRNTIIIHHL